MELRLSQDAELRETRGSLLQGEMAIINTLNFDAGANALNKWIPLDARDETIHIFGQKQEQGLNGRADLWSVYIHYHPHSIPRRAWETFFGGNSVTIRHLFDTDATNKQEPKITIRRSNGNRVFLVETGFALSQETRVYQGRLSRDGNALLDPTEFDRRVAAQTMSVLRDDLLRVAGLLARKYPDPSRRRTADGQRIH